MKSSFEQTLIEVWQQSFVEDSKMVVLGGEKYPVRRTPKRGLRQVDFVFDGNEIRGLEQNPGALWQEGGAVLHRRPLCGECGGWKSDALLE